MRTFHSYGPVDRTEHYCVERKELVDQCIKQLVGKVEKGGHYFTIWGARQTGKTWIVEQSVNTIRQEFKDQLKIACISMQGFADDEQENVYEKFFSYWPGLMEDEFHVDTGRISSWTRWLELFNKQRGIFDSPVILLIDEFDKLQTKLINQLVSLFREMYLKRNNYYLHGLALVGVRSVLGVDNKSGSPFNVQRSLHVGNLSLNEVKNMFDQYQEESKQKIIPDIIKKLYEKTLGQPGLIGWFGELLTEKYNQTPDKKINMNLWDRVYLKACEIEHNNTVRNIITKAKNEYTFDVVRLFTDANVHFSFDYDSCNYMYMHGIITYDYIENESGNYHVCRFSSPFIQNRLYNAFIGEIKKEQDRSILALDPLDALEDITSGLTLNLPALLNRYKEYLLRLKENGLNPWQNQPRRKKDFHLTEAVGHFHLYHIIGLKWL